jgi:hypothetical protein
MTPVAILLEHNKDLRLYRAVSAGHTSTGTTPGEALDSLLAQPGFDISSAVLIRPFAADEFFTQEQHDRMQDLLARRESLTDSENEELDALIDAELDATVRRTASLLPGNGR